MEVVGHNSWKDCLLVKDIGSSHEDCTGLKSNHAYIASIPIN